MSRFEELADKLSGKKGVYSPRGLAAYIGREKYGASGMAKLSAAGRKGGGRAKRGKKK